MNVSGLHVIIDPVRVPQARLPAFTAAIADGGATVLQIRIKDHNTRAALAYSDTALRHAKDCHLLVVVNDRVDWALAIGADGVHLGTDDMPIDRARHIAPKLLVGASAGTSQELAQALRHQPDYIGIGPVFVTTSKSDAGDPLGPSGVRQLLTNAMACPVVAIGGITPTNASEVWKTGVDALAVIAAVTEARDPKQAVQALLRARQA